MQGCPKSILLQPELDVQPTGLPHMQPSQLAQPSMQLPLPAPVGQSIHSTSMLAGLSARMQMQQQQQQPLRMHPRAGQRGHIDSVSLQHLLGQNNSSVWAAAPGMAGKCPDSHVHVHLCIAASKQCSGTSVSGSRLSVLHQGLPACWA